MHFRCWILFCNITHPVLFYQLPPLQYDWMWAKQYRSTNPPFKCHFQTFTSTWVGEWSSEFQSAAFKKTNTWDVPASSFTYLKPLTINWLSLPSSFMMALFMVSMLQSTDHNQTFFSVKFMLKISESLLPFCLEVLKTKERLSGKLASFE